MRYKFDRHTDMLLTRGFSRRQVMTMLGMGAAGGLVSACSNSDEVSLDAEFNMVIAHTLPTDHSNHKGYEMFAQKVMEESDGRISARVFPNAVFGADRQLVEAIQMDNIQLSAPSSSPVAAFSPKMNVWDIPYIFEDRKHAYRVLDSKFGQGTLDELSKVNLIGLGYWENGFRHLTHNVDNIKLPDGLRGLKVRTQENPTQIEAWKATGASATPMAFTEVYTGLQQGTIDAQENPLALITAQRFYEVQKYLTLSAHVYGPMPLVLSKRFNDRLPSEFQELMREAGDETKAFCREAAVGDEERAIATVKEAGTKVNEPDQNERDEMAITMRKAAEPLLDSLLGNQFMNEFRSALGE